MKQFCLAVVRFCLCAWVGIATFFVMVVIELRQSALFVEDVKFNHPKVLFPLYYGFELPLLGTALACAAAGIGNQSIGRTRRIALLILLLAAMAAALWDYGIIYRDLLKMMESQPLPPEFHALHRISRHVNEAVLTLATAAALLALWPQKSAEGMKS